MNVNPPEICPTGRYPLGSLRFLTHPVQRYLLAVTLVGLSFLAQSALEAVLQYRSPYLFFYPALMLSALLSGWGPGLVATILAGLLVTLNTAEGVSLGFFLSQGFVVTGVAGIYHRMGTKLSALERERMEEAERHHAALFSTLVGQAPMAMYVVNAEFKIQEISAQAVRAFGHAGSLPGRNFAEVLEWMWGPDVGREVTGILKNTLKTGEPYVSPSSAALCHEAGQQRYYEWETQRTTLVDGQDGLVSYFTDVTERNETERELRDCEERVRLATTATGVGIWERKLFTDTIRWDAEMFRIYGITPTEDGVVSYQTWCEALTTEDLKHQQAILQRTVEDGGQSTRKFQIVRASDNRRRSIQSVETTRKNSRGQVEWIVGTNLDITERKEVEDALRTLNQKLEFRVAERTSEMRAAVIALKAEISTRERLEREILEIAEREQCRLGQDLHDGLNQELAGIALLTSALASELQSHPSAPAAERIVEYTNSAIESARTLARGLYPIELGRRGLLFALNDLAALTTLRFGISCTLREVGTAPMLEPSVAIHIYRIMQECVSNSIKHGKPTSIIMESCSEESAHVFTVRDNGRGFHNKPLCNGMGLNIMEYRARVIGAQIQVTSPAEGGCLVTCRRPS